MIEFHRNETYNELRFSSIIKIGNKCKAKIGNFKQPICLDPTDLLFELPINWTKVQPYHINRTYGSPKIFLEIRLTRMGQPPYASTLFCNLSFNFRGRNS